MTLPIRNETSLKTRKVLKEWKIADLVPNYKKGNKELLNYKPVSLTSKVCKICQVI